MKKKHFRSEKAELVDKPAIDCPKKVTLESKRCTINEYIKQQLLTGAVTSKLESVRILQRSQ